MELTPCCVPYGKLEAVWLEGRLIKNREKIGFSIISLMRKTLEYSCKYSILLLNPTVRVHKANFLV